MMRLEYLLVVVALVVGAVLLRTQFDRAIGDVTNPDPDATPFFRVVTPVVKPLCGPAYNGADCLKLP
jgi:hypothetical protein